jgi:hypothetical protein
VSTPRFEAFLVRLYVDADARRQFLADPRGTALRAGLHVGEAEALAKIDRVGLELSSRSFERKRAAARQGSGRRLSWLRWLLPRRRSP